MLLTPPVDAVALRVVRVRDEVQLRGFASQWDALAAGVPFRTWEWVETWWRHYRNSRSELFTLIVVDEQGQLVGVAPWYLTHSQCAGRIVRFLGSGEVCSDYLTLLCRPGTELNVAAKVSDWLAGEGASEWDLLDLSGVEQADPLLGEMRRRLAERGHVVDARQDMSCWRTELPETWDAFLAGLTKSRRERTRALQRKTFAAGRAIVHEVTTQAELDGAFEILIDLHQKRRRSLSQAGCFASARFTAFHREIAGRFLDSGQLRLSWVELDGRPMSAAYSFVGHQTVYYYQGGFEPELASESPGWLSFAADIQRAIEQGYRAYDFLRGDESYKTSWKAEARPLARVRIGGRSPLAQLRFATWRAADAVKARARRILLRTKVK